MTDMENKQYNDGDFNNEITGLAVAQEREALKDAINEVKRHYPSDVPMFQEATIEETAAFPKDVQFYISRASATMARKVCDNLHKIIEEREPAHKRELK